MDLIFNKYVLLQVRERDLDKSIIDWSGLTKTISDNLMAETQNRENKKLELEKAYQDQLAKINEYEQGLDPDLNQVVMQQSQQTRDFLHENHKLMKQGVRSVNDANLIKQNVANSWSSFNNSVKSYNENLERLSKLPGKGNQALMEEIGQELMLKNKKIHWDESGNGYWADIDPKGNIDMKTLRPLKAISNLRNQSFSFVDVNKNTDDVVNKVKDWEVFINDTTNVSDARNNPAYNNWINNTIDSALSSDEKIASVLMDYLNFGYNLNGSPSNNQVSLVYNKDTGKMDFKLTADQIKLAKDAYRDAIEVKIGKKVSKKTPTGTPTVKPPKANQGNIDKLMRSMTPTPNQFDPAKMDPPNELLVRNNVQNIARDLKLDQQKVTVSGGKVFYNNVEIGDINTSTAQDIVDKLNSYATPNSGPMSIYNP